VQEVYRVCLLLPAFFKNKFKVLKLKVKKKKDKLQIKRKTLKFLTFAFL